MEETKNLTREGLGSMVASDIVLLTDGSYCDKIEAHVKGSQHYAFSVMIFDSLGNLLIQKRAKDKYHSGGLWSNACCGHPLTNSSIDLIQIAATKRLEEEMGICCKLKFDYCFKYKIDCGTLTENEVDYVFGGIYDYENPISLNKSEVENYRWVTREKLLEEMHSNPNAYTSWFRLLLNHF